MAIGPHITAKIADYYKKIGDEEAYQAQIASNEAIDKVHKAYNLSLLEPVKYRKAEVMANGRRIKFIGEKGDQIAIEITGYFSFWQYYSCQYNQEVIDSKNVFVCNNTFPEPRAISSCTDDQIKDISGFLWTKDRLTLVKV